MKLMSVVKSKDSWTETLQLANKTENKGICLFWILKILQILFRHCSILRDQPTHKTGKLSLSSKYFDSYDKVN